MRIGHVVVLLCGGIIASAQARAERFKTVDGEVVIESEMFTRLGGSVGGPWSVETTLPDYRGDGYMQSSTDEPSTLQFDEDTARTEYDIRFDHTGTYYLHLRSYAEDLTQNGFFATIDGVQFDYGHEEAFYVWVRWFENNPKWWWYTDGGGAGARDYKVSIEVADTGMKTLAIYRRDKGSRVDRIWLTKHESNPQPSGTLPLPDPSIFILNNEPDGGVDASDGDGSAGVDASDGDGSADVDASDGDGSADVDASDGDGSAGVDASDGDGSAGVDASDGDGFAGVDAQTDARDAAGSDTDRQDGDDAPPSDDPTDQPDAGQDHGEITGGCGCGLMSGEPSETPFPLDLFLIGLLLALQGAARTAKP